MHAYTMLPLETAWCRWLAISASSNRDRQTCSRSTEDKLAAVNEKKKKKENLQMEVVTVNELSNKWIVVTLKVIVFTFEIRNKKKKMKSEAAAETLFTGAKANVQPVKSAGKHGNGVKCRKTWNLCKAREKVSLVQYENKCSKAREKDVTRKQMEPLQSAGKMQKVKAQTFGQAGISLYMLLQLLTFIFKADMIWGIC